MRQMCLNLFFAASGYHNGGWRMPGSRSGELLELDYNAQIAQQAERAKMDALFVADRLDVSAKDYGKYPAKFPLEPITQLASLAAATSHIGLIATMSTSYTEPHLAAELFASLDYLSGGRSGWNIVTSFSGSENFGRPLSSHSDRYKDADAFVSEVVRLWAMSPKGGMPPLPQGRPLIVQAGASVDGMNFAGKWAEVIFTAQSNLESARSFYEAAKNLVRSHGRSPDQVKVLPGLMPIVGDTQAEAEEIVQQLGDRIDFEIGRANLKIHGFDLIDDLELDEAIPADRLRSPDEVQGARSRYELMYNLAKKEGVTLGDLIKVTTSSSGHALVAGTSETVADTMQDWFTTGACDGFNIEAPYFSEGFTRFTDQVIPILQERGLFRHEYEGETLRSNLGLTDAASTRDDRHG